METFTVAELMSFENPLEHQCNGYSFHYTSNLLKSLIPILTEYTKTGQQILKISGNISSKSTIEFIRNILALSRSHRITVIFIENKNWDFFPEFGSATKVER